MADDQVPADRSRTRGLGPHVVGQRVVVRRVLRGETGPTGGPAMTDVLGVCESWEGGLARVRREDGTVVEIRTADIVSGKPVPPRPPVRHRVDEVDADRRVVAGWRPVETERLGDWLLRASGGFSSRGNSVLALGDPGLGLADVISRVAQWYGERSLPPRAHVLPGGEVDRVLEEAGWTAYDATDVLIGSVARISRQVGPSSVEVMLGDVVDGAWLATDPRAERYGADARSVLEAGEVAFATVRDEDGSVLARGRGSVHDDWLGLSCLWTREDRRSSGLGTVVLAALVEWGAERGAMTAYVQVLADNDRARALYESLGLAVHHRYGYRVAPGS